MPAGTALFHSLTSKRSQTMNIADTLLSTRLSSSHTHTNTHTSIATYINAYRISFCPAQPFVSSVHWRDCIELSLILWEQSAQNEQQQQQWQTKWLCRAIACFFDYVNWAGSLTDSVLGRLYSASSASEVDGIVCERGSETIVRTNQSGNAHVLLILLFNLSPTFVFYFTASSCSFTFGASLKDFTYIRAFGSSPVIGVLCNYYSEVLCAQNGRRLIR